MHPYSGPFGMLRSVWICDEVNASWCPLQAVFTAHREQRNKGLAPLRLRPGTASRGQPGGGAGPGAGSRYRRLDSDDGVVW
ncbi:unnamed protein product [Gadus morhua 'NCC']